MRRIKRGETVRHLELLLHRPDQGWEKVVSYSGAMVETAGGERLIFLSAYDLTEQRKAEAAMRLTGGANLMEDAIAAREEAERAENALQTNLQRFYDVLSSMYSGILLVTDEGRVEFANQAFCDRFGLEDAPADLVGLGAREMIEKAKGAYVHPDEAVARIEEILNRGEPVKGEEVAMRDGGACLRDFVRLNVKGKSYGRLWHHFDISERNRPRRPCKSRRRIGPLQQGPGPVRLRGFARPPGAAADGGRLRATAPERVGDRLDAEADTLSATPWTARSGCRH